MRRGSWAGNARMKMRKGGLKAALSIFMSTRDQRLAVSRPMRLNLAFCSGLSAV